MDGGGGWQQVINQQDYINSLDQKNIQAWPLNGCPGPIEVEVSDKVVLALMEAAEGSNLASSFFMILRTSDVLIE